MKKSGKTVKRARSLSPPPRKPQTKKHIKEDSLDEDYVNKNYSSIIQEMFGYRRQDYDDEDSDDMEVSMADIRREELKR
jgi:hypothetical protein